MKTGIVYVHPHGWTTQAARFLDSYSRNPPGGPHDSYVVCNGGPADDETNFFFSSLPNLSLIQHNNAGFDIGAFQLAAAIAPCDLLIFFGASAYFRGGGWLPRVLASAREYGDTLYGATGNQGDGRVNVYPHVRTTGFWCSPGLMNRFPWRCTDASQRYRFEHGKDGLTTWVWEKERKRPMVIAWRGEADVFSCDQIIAGFHRGDQANVIFGDRLTQTPFGPDP